MIEPHLNYFKLDLVSMENSREKLQCLAFPLCSFDKLSSDEMSGHGCVVLKQLVSTLLNCKKKLRDFISTESLQNLFKLCKKYSSF